MCLPISAKFYYVTITTHLLSQSEAYIHFYNSFYRTCALIFTTHLTAASVDFKEIIFYPALPEKAGTKKDKERQRKTKKDKERQRETKKDKERQRKAKTDKDRQR